MSLGDIYKPRGTSLRMDMKNMLLIGKVFRNAAARRFFLLEKETTEKHKLQLFFLSSWKEWFENGTKCGCKNPGMYCKSYQHLKMTNKVILILLRTHYLETEQVFLLFNGIDSEISIISCYDRSTFSSAISSLKKNCLDYIWKTLSRVGKIFNFKFESTQLPSNIFASTSCTWAINKEDRGNSSFPCSDVISVRVDTMM